MKENKVACPGCRKTICNGCKIYQKLNTNKKIPVHFPNGFNAKPQKGLGISFDLGTTTVAGMLWDLENIRLLAVETANNPQGMVGADVVSRVQYALNEEPVGKPHLQKLIVSCMDEMAKKLFAEKRSDIVKEKNSERTSEIGSEKVIKREEQECDELVRNVVLVGNTAMCELFLGLRPVQIAKAPFTPDYTETCNIQGAKLGFQFLKEALFTVLPPIGGYVGSDALAVYHSVCAKEKDETVLIMDIGTNGELLLRKEGKCYACSVAAGPSLEGGAISSGMRASIGAIEQVVEYGNFPMQDLICKTVNDTIPVGICGSGLIDTVALLCKLNIIDSTGYLKNKSEAINSGSPRKICERLETITPEETNRFLLTDKEHSVYITAEDIRQLQLAISAIRTGVFILLKMTHTDMKHIDRLYIAGAFGSFIRISSGVALGLFPDIPVEKITQAGNLASQGAAMVLLSQEEQDLMQKEVKEIIHIELAEQEDFTNLLLKNMKFPNGEKSIFFHEE